MSYSSYNPQTRYRERSKKRVFSIIVSLLFFGCLAGGGFFLGQQFAKNELSILEEELSILEEERISLRTELTELSAQVQTANVTVQGVKDAYQQAIPDGPVEGLIVLLHQQIRSGVQVERLKHIIETAQSPKICSDPEINRFVVSTPEFKGPKSEVLVEEFVLVRASGVSAVNKEMEPEAWYDPTKEVHVSFKVGDQEPVTKKGVMPINYAFVVEDKEYRFQVEAGAKSFMKVTHDVCNAP